MATTTRQTLKQLRAEGYEAEVVERWLPKVNLRRDLFHCIDVVAVRRGEAGVLGVQCTSLVNLSARVRKATMQPELRTWLAAGNRFEVWGWTQRHDGKWDSKRVALAAEDMTPLVLRGPPRKRRERKAGQLMLFAE
jgi:hypothetical protein